ncbi:MAG: cytochrome c biogenesis protein CcsA [Deltaproteobacteria bacterium]|jgi:heme exporter protein C|nr:cytochrome c biogenesis protein CcsA [SAR324 cluster bacterium]MEC8261495.1 cytochrome c biogenesis protein CcsA [SAR324 cluster bacterium]MEC8358663.1 cytochrome c biogenesis protein CcsA [SAR324 cluster bacterium]MEC8542792.1 cytochrome c biogenesis protein CcsA [SAR324 cluster bacterium]MEC8595414.1 cytochrome c biogenesis protein CcsA [SAR324 cluster bacterium]
MDSAARWTARLEIIAPLTLLACGLWVFVFAPTETEQGFVQKIMYIHVPSVIVTYLAFFVTFAFGIAYLWKRLLVFDRIAKVSAEIGLIFCAMVLLSGAIWGRPTWGTYWVWDARLTTTLLLFLIFLGYFLLRLSVQDREKEARFASVLGIIGFLDIPIVHKSVEWWRTLHQPSTLFKVEEGAAKPAMPPELLYPLLASMFAMLLFYGYLMLLRWQMEENQDQLHEALAQEVN